MKFSMELNYAVIQQKLFTELQVTTGIGNEVTLLFRDLDVDLTTQLQAHNYYNTTVLLCKVFTPHFAALSIIHS